MWGGGHVIFASLKAEEKSALECGQIVCRVGINIGCRGASQRKNLFEDCLHSEEGFPSLP